MKLVFLIGPSAVGKMTVGQELAKTTNLDLLHNHQTIDLVMETRGFYDFELISRLRKEIVTYYASIDKNGLIMTFRHRFDSLASLSHIANIVDVAYNNLLKPGFLEVYIVELDADLDTRLIRNKTENRLNYKKCKRDIEESEYELIEAEASGIYHSNSIEELEKEFSSLNANEIKVLKIDNTDKSVEIVAETIRKFIGQEV